MASYIAYLAFRLSAHRRHVLELVPHTVKSTQATEWKGSKHGEIHIVVALLAFGATTALLYFTVDNLVANITSALEDAGVSLVMASTIIIPVLNCDLAALTQTDHSIDLAFASTIRKSVQAALFIAPMLVIVG